MTLPTHDEHHPPIKESPVIYEEKIEPRQAQIESLAALEETLTEEYSKAMVVMATGLGKTHLAAFFAKRFKKLLFIAQREEIIKQAKISFEQVLKNQVAYFMDMKKIHTMIWCSLQFSP